MPGTVAAVGYAFRWLTHSVTVVAAVVMVINDHVLKPTFPGVATGKLSDVAGMLVVPPLVAMVLALAWPRLQPAQAVAAALAVTALGFALVKTTEVGAAIASQAWTSVVGPSLVRRDPSDLIALPALAIACWVALSCARAESGPTWSGRAVHAVRTSAAVLLVVFAVAATSAPDGPPYVAGVAIWRDQVVADVAYDTCTPASPDGVAHWRCLTKAEADAFFDEPVEAGAQASRACDPQDPRHCYRVNRRSDSRYAFDSVGLIVEESVDAGATWRAAWELAQGREDFLRRGGIPEGRYATNGPWTNRSSCAVFRPAVTSSSSPTASMAS